MPDNKNIPKKVKIKFYDGINTICPFICPTCDHPVLLTRCPNCGQLLITKNNKE